MTAFYQDLLRRNRLLAITGSGYFILFFCLLALSLVDNTIILGINRWIKPMKFALSIGIFAWTFAYLIDELPYSQRRSNRFSQIIFWTMLLEIAAIVGQAARGELSHFNTDSALGGIIFSLMGIAIMIVFVITCWMTVDYFTKKVNLPKSVLWGIRIGLLVLIFGNIGGMMMSSLLSHSVGVEDGGAGLPVTNWSTIAGDLRVMHFFGLHGIQLFPLLAFSMVRLNLLKTEGQRVALIVMIGLLYAGFVVATFLQALNGQPFIQL